MQRDATLPVSSAIRFSAKHERGGAGRDSKGGAKGWRWQAWSTAEAPQSRLPSRSNELGRGTQARSTGRGAEPREPIEAEVSEQSSIQAPLTTLPLLCLRSHPHSTAASVPPLLSASPRIAVMSAQAAYPDTMAASKKTLIYVGGLDEAVDDAVLTAAFRPFGELQKVLIPKDAASRQSSAQLGAEPEAHGISLDRFRSRVSLCLSLCVLFRVSRRPEKHRGFGFVEFELPEDAAAALENMHDSELFGRVLKCNLAKPGAAGGRGGGAIWAGEAADAWYGNAVPKSAEEVDAAMQHAANQEAKTKA